MRNLRRAQRCGVTSALGLAASLLLGGAAPANAAVEQPDGVAMPLASPDNEISLQELFDFREGDGVLSAIDDASTEPATFKPLCDFSAQLLLHETGSNAAVGWYNSPAGNVPPTTICDEKTGLSSGGGPCTAQDIFVLIPGDVALPPKFRPSDPLNHPGAVFNGADLAANPLYAGGDIGFVLLSSQLHYSETRLDPPCVGAACKTPGNWIPTIMYASVKTPRGYYMCSEDQDVGPETWGKNDGDFNDFAFLFTGLVCSGSGEACDTGEPGICAAGLTDCANAKGESECRQARQAGTETCNGLDDDCNGDTDEGMLCGPGEKCVRARCVPECGTGEFRCAANHECIEGACIEAACVDANCAAGTVCIGGKCVGACDDVGCPTGQTCTAGVCTNPCDGIDCGEGFVCEGGACLVACSCAGCAAGECDANSGHCVDDGCAGVGCDSGQHCAAGGDCVDDCVDAQCPGGAACTSGACEPPGEPAAAGAGGETGGFFPLPNQGGANDGSGNASNGTGNSSNSNQSGADGRPELGSDGHGSVEVASGCACRSAGAGSTSAAAFWATLALALGGARRRRQRSRQN